MVTIVLEDHLWFDLLCSNHVDCNKEWIFLEVSTDLKECSDFLSSENTLELLAVEDFLLEFFERFACLYEGLSALAVAATV